MRKTAELSSNEQTHIYMAGCLQFINFLIASRLFYSIPWHYCCSQESPMFSPTTEGMTKTKSIHAAPCLLSATSLPLLILENTDTLFSWIPHHYHPGMLHKQLIVSLPTTPWEKQKPAPCIGSSGVVSKPSLGRGGCFAELTRPPAWPGTETDRKGGKAPGQWSGHEFFLLLWEERVAFIYSCSIQVSQSLSCRKLAWEVTRVAWFSLWCFLLWHFICFNAVVSPIIGSIQCISQAEHLENEKHLDGSSFSTRGQHED